MPGHSRASVEVDVSVYEKTEEGPEKLLVSWSAYRMSVPRRDVSPGKVVRSGRHHII